MKWTCFACDSGPLAHSVQVTLFSSRRNYLRYLRPKRLTDGRRITGRGTAAKMLAYSPEQAAAYGVDAEMVFYDAQFTADAIAHEVTHALIHVFRAAGRSPLDAEHEEDFATLHGRLTQAILDWKADA